MSLAPRLRHRIKLQTQARVPDGYGGSVLSWVDVVDNLPAEVKPLSGKEFLQAQSVQSSIGARIVIRYRGGVEPQMRAVFEGRAYNIAAVVPDSTAWRQLVLMVDAGQPEFGAP